jgi:hypothetical protein
MAVEALRGIFRWFAFEAEDQLLSRRDLRSVRAGIHHRFRMGLSRAVA